MSEEASLAIWAEQPLAECSACLWLVFSVDWLHLVDEFVIAMSKLALVAIPASANLYPIFAHLSLILSFICFKLLRGAVLVASKSLRLFDLVDWWLIHLVIVIFLSILVIDCIKSWVGLEMVIIQRWRAHLCVRCLVMRVFIIVIELIVAYYLIRVGKVQLLVILRVFWPVDISNVA